MCNLIERIYVVNSLAVAFRKGVVESFGWLSILGAILKHVSKGLWCGAPFSRELHACALTQRYSNFAHQR